MLIRICDLLIRPPCYIVGTILPVTSSERSDGFYTPRRTRSLAVSLLFSLAPGENHISDTKAQIHSHLPDMVKLDDDYAREQEAPKLPWIHTPLLESKSLSEAAGWFVLLASSLPTRHSPSPQFIQTFPN